MLNDILELVRKEVNSFINKKLQIDPPDNRVLLTSFVDETGNVAIPENKVGFYLLNIEEEKHLKIAGLIQTQKSEIQSSFINTPVNLNLKIIFAAYFDEFMESLKHLSCILSCFQSKPVFDEGNTPGMSDLHTKKLIFELNTIDLEQQHHIWSTIGIRHLPSAIYKVKMLTVQEQDIVSKVSNIRGITADARRKEVKD